MLKHQLTDHGHRESLLNGLAEVRRRLGGGGASARAADIALEIIASSNIKTSEHPDHG